MSGSVRWVYALGLVFAAGRVLMAQPHVDFDVDLVALHPEITASDSFREWLNGHRVIGWSESKADSSQVVNVENSTHSIFSGKIDLSNGPARLVEPTIFSEPEVIGSRRQAIERVKRRDPGATIVGTRPLVSQVHTKKALGWEVYAEHSDKSRFFVDSLGQLHDLALVVPRAIVIHPCPVAADDSLSADELHHPSLFVSAAAACVGHAQTIRDKADAICHCVHRDMTYDSNTPGITELIWSDVNTRNNQYRGVCDEYANLAITYLRALGIPARLRLLRWYYNDVEEGHAIAEYLDGGVWYHMDPTHDRLRKPEIYRQSGSKQVRVIDADWPEDARSSSLSYNFPDVDGDEKLNSWADFCLAPDANGVQLQGYSFP